jgi:hypothetical protein
MVTHNQGTTIKKIHVLFAVLTLTLSTIMACRPQMDEVVHPSYRLGTVALSAEQIQTAVRNGLVAARWEVQNEEPGRTVGRVDVGNHYAKVEVVYSVDEYVINPLETSESLGYDGQYVHKRYTFWANRLNHSIQNEIYKISSQQNVGGATPEVQNIPVSNGETSADDATTSSVDEATD